jgi:hypothetical protein
MIPDIAQEAVMSTRRAHCGQTRAFGMKPMILLSIGFVAGALAIGTLRTSRPVFAAPAGGGSQSSLISCAVRAEYDESSKLQLPLEGVVFLDYSRGKLVGTMPEMLQIGLNKRILSNFTERDLVEDFAIEPKNPVHFLMSTIYTGVTSDRSQLLVVVEAHSRKTRIYKLGYLQQGVIFKPQFEMLEKKVFDAATNVNAERLIPGAAAPGAVPAQQ